MKQHPPCQRCERPVGDDRALCPTCGEELIDALRAIPGLVADLAVLRAGQARLTPVRTGGRSADTRLPVQLADRRGRGRVWTMQGERALTRLETSVTTWARRLARTLAVPLPVTSPGLIQLALNARHDPRRGGREETTALVTAHHVRHVRRHPDALADTPATGAELCAIWLACHPHELRTHPRAGDIAADIGAAVDGLRRVVDRPPDRRYLGPCPTALDGVDDEGRPRVCGYELRVEPGKAWVKCARCKQQHDVALIEAAARTHAEDGLWTVAELVSILASIGRPVPRSTLYDWAHKHKIAPRGYQHDTRITDHKIDDTDPAVYRLGDVLALANREPIDPAAQKERA
ncbi:hypothetical protein [Nocardia sp. NPDC057455]|uniref:hypothetical protein n=1 Tax=Nocardia sp. NPDC057455 TaxID=3346138 RepID=UPI0036710268